jgi:hypothetical protein
MRHGGIANRQKLDDTGGIERAHLGHVGQALPDLDELREDPVAGAPGRE